LNERVESGRLRASLLVGLALFGVALLVRLYRLDAQSLWLDEGSSWELSRAGWGYLLRELFNPTAAYPLYHLLLKGWMGVFGDAEWALRLPSALAGAGAAAAVYFAAVELERLGERGTGGLGIARRQRQEIPQPPNPPITLFALAAALIALAAPYAIWYGQEAKVYALLLLCAALITWALPRALRTNARRDWAVLAAACVVALFVHRLSALLTLAAGWAALALARPQAGPTIVWGGRRRLLGGALLAAASVGLVAAMVAGLGSESAATGAYIPAGPASALWLTLVRFSVDRWPGDAPWWWVAPWLALLAWGLARALLDLRVAARRRTAAVLLTLLFVPVLLFLAQLLFTRVYEARYLIIAFPAWALLLAYPLAARPNPQAPIHAALLACALLTAGLALFQPTFGLFSGDPVKEQYREAIGELAAHVHPDDAVVIHPGYIRPLYDYYMGRWTADPAPEPLTFGNFWRGPTAYGQREWDIERREKLAGRTRSFLLIAPDHARTVDVPRPGDEYGLLGNYWAYSREQNTWPCGIWRYNGAHLLCQEAPEAYYTGEVQRPATPSGAVFGGEIELLGFTMKPTTPAGPGVYRAGGTLPISLFWDVARQQSRDLSVFLHLCQRCDVPPAAGDDGPPLEGYLPTSTWLPGKPARDDRAIVLPPGLAPGRYTLLVGLYDPAIAGEAGRLAVRGGETLGDDRLVLGTVEIVAGE
jgi:mannosyltransferase